MGRGAAKLSTIKKVKSKKKKKTPFPVYKPIWVGFFVIVVLIR